MKTEYRRSCGVIPIIGTPESYRILLINQRDSKLSHYWTFPKGTPEAGESPRETAIRETAEEVGIVCDAVDEEFSFINAYEFEEGETIYKKEVIYFVGRAPSEAFVLQEKEVREARWCSPEEAMALMTFEGMRAFFEDLAASGALERLLS